MINCNTSVVIFTGVAFTTNNNFIVSCLINVIGMIIHLVRKRGVGIVPKDIFRVH